MTTATQVLDKARSFLGTGSAWPASKGNAITRQYGPPGWGLSKLYGGYDWCAVSTYVWARLAGDSTLVSASPFVVDHVARHRALGSWLGRTSTPRPGDEVMFDWEGDGKPNHVGLVETVIGDTFTTIEGNSGDVCRRRSYKINAAVVFGFGRPSYSGASTSPAGNTGGAATNPATPNAKDESMPVFLPGNVISWPNGFTNAYDPTVYEACRLASAGDTEPSRVATLIRESWYAADFMTERNANAAAAATAAVLRASGVPVNTKLDDKGISDIAAKVVAALPPVPTSYTVTPHK